ncbi:calcium-binding protein [Chlamydia sp.]|uniref:calcium-binding protein n=1 Tax=Chlamydia sp. TaxID=35827 RepID=UPI0025BD3832|nr:calcium-binding protein [Chlamydia sp.]MBQ8498516.1 calcium-binding protein [Chlamydia sp.]
MEKTRKFETALENLEQLKKISYDYSNKNAETSSHHKALSEMKQALHYIDHYFKQTGAIPQKDIDKAIKETDFLIAGVQDVFSFLEDRQEDIYRSLSEDYFHLNHTYDVAREHLNKVVEQEAPSPSLEICQDQEEFLNNLVEVKKDRSYELFYMANENNKRFYTDTLAQIIYKQGKIHESMHENDPLTKTIVWNSDEITKLASSLVYTNDMPIRLFYKKALTDMSAELTVNVHNALMALFLARYEATGVSCQPKKENISYFNDFLYFLRKASTLLNEKDLLDLQEKHSQSLVSLLSAKLYDHTINFEEASNYIVLNISSKLQQEEGKKPLSAGQYVAEIYDELHRLFSRYPSGPLFKAIDRMLDPYLKEFDPILLGILPCLEGKLTQGDKAIRIIRAPSPVSQSSILYANCNGEFLHFLDAKTCQGDKILVINIQNRLSRKDRARSRVIEESLQNYASVHICAFPEPEDLLDGLEKVHGELETFVDFFSSVQQEFFKFKAQGFCVLPEEVKEDVGIFLEHIVPALKDVFFSKKKILFKNDKILLLHLIYYFIVFNLVEQLDPNIMLIMSKDGLDYASVFVTGFAFFEDRGSWDEDSLKWIVAKMLAPTLVARDRLVFAQHVELFSKFLNCLRKNRQNLKALRNFFSYDLERWNFSGT